MQKQFGKRADLQFSLVCHGPKMGSVDFDYKKLTESEFSTKPARLLIDLPDDSATIHCVLTVINDGTDDAKSVFVDAQLGNVSRFSGGRRSSDIPEFREIEIAANGNKSSALEGNLNLGQWPSITQSSLTNSPYSLPFDVIVNDSLVQFFTMQLSARGQNLKDHIVIASFQFRRPSGR